MTDELPEGHYLRWPSEDIIKWYDEPVGPLVGVGEPPYEWITDEARDAMLERICQSLDLPLSLFGPAADNPFHDYTPFPRLDAAERKARAAAIEGRERLVAAWKVLRSGDRDPFHEGCDRCGW